MSVQSKKVIPFPSKLSAAMSLTRRGFRVFRIKPDCKSGAGKFIDNDWISAATANKLAVYDKWEASPDANIGILTNGLCVIDVDVKNGTPGMESLNALEDECGVLPPTYTQRTPSGGLHYVFDAGDREVPSSAGKLAPGIDVRGYHGLLMGAGSVIDGKAYTVEHDLPIAPLPEPWRERIMARKVRAATVATGEIDSELNIKIAQYMLEGEEPAVQGHGGDSRTIVVANMVMDYGLSPAVTFEVMQDWNDRCAPPWTPTDLQRKIESAAASRQNAIGCHNPTSGFSVVDIAALPSAEAQGETHSWLDDVGYLKLDAAAVEAFKPRPWIVPGLLMRGVITEIMAPGATGKTALQMQLAAAVATDAMHAIAVTGADGKPSYALREPTKCLVINFEDSQEELERRAGAAFKHFDLNYLKADDRLKVASASDRNFKLLVRADKNRLVESPQVDALIAHVIKEQFGVIMLDPLADLHEAKESDNDEMRRVADVLRKIATRTNAAVLIAHHTRKASSASSDGQAGNMDVARGASSLVSAVRIALTLFHMTVKDADEMGIAQDQRHKYVRLDDAKMNLVLSSPFARWFRKDTVHVGIEAEGMGAFVPVSLPLPKKTVDMGFAEHTLDLLKNQLPNLLPTSPIGNWGAAYKFANMAEGSRGLKQDYESALSFLEHEGRIEKGPRSGKDPVEVWHITRGQEGWPGGVEVGPDLRST